jgi:hypothetical protein
MSKTQINSASTFEKAKVEAAQGMINPEWLEFFSDAYFAIAGLQQSGTTANRPTKRLYIGMPYYDTTLGYSINIHSLNPTVWHNGAGAVV